MGRLPGGPHAACSSIIGRAVSREPGRTAAATCTVLGDGPRSRTSTTRARRSSAREFVGTSITSQFRRPQAEVDALLADNPHIRLGNGHRRGYVRIEITRDRLRADLRTVRSVARPSAEVDTLATFVIEDGRPGARPRVAFPGIGLSNETD